MNDGGLMTKNAASAFIFVRQNDYRNDNSEIWTNFLGG